MDWSRFNVTPSVSLWRTFVISVCKLFSRLLYWLVGPVTVMDVRVTVSVEWNGTMLIVWSEVTIGGDLLNQPQSGSRVYVVNNSLRRSMDFSKNLDSNNKTQTRSQWACCECMVSRLSGFPVFASNQGQWWISHE